MSTLAGDNDLLRPPLPPGVRIVRVGSDLLDAAAVRLVGDQHDDPVSAGRRFLSSAAGLGIDLSRIWATVPEVAGRDGAVRQACLAVFGTGRTAMLFISGPPRATRRGGGEHLGSSSAAAQERAAVIRVACEHVAAGDAAHPPAVLAQALLEEREKDALTAFRLAGFTQVGDLAYMRRLGGVPALPPTLPEGVSLRSLAELVPAGFDSTAIDALLKGVLERSYIDTQDCPELCGLRSADDVLESHRLVGRFDPANWWVIFDGPRPIGCMLFNVLPEQESAELVYLGLDPDARGRGIAGTALAHGLRHLLGRPYDGGVMARGPVRVGPGGVNCAVDTRNAAALRLYRRAGFQRFAVRIPVVLGLSSP